MPPREIKDAGRPDAGRPGRGPGWRPQMFSHVVTNTEQIERLNASGGIAVDFSRLGRNPVHLAFEGGQSRTLCLWATSSRHGFRSTPKFATDLFTLRFVTQGALVRHNITGDPVISRVELGTFVDFEDMRDEQASAAFSSISATVSRGTIERARLALDGDATDAFAQFAPFVELKTAGLRALRQTLWSLHLWLRAGSHELDLVAPMLEELVVYQLISAWPMVTRSRTPTDTPSSRALRLAMDYMDANLSRSMTMAEIAGAAGVSIRTLQSTFKRAFHVSPMTYLIACRLDRVREALGRPDGRTIREIATQWGFVHMSDFSRRYRQRFGQLPSDTKQTS